MSRACVTVLTLLALLAPAGCHDPDARPGAAAQAAKAAKDFVAFAHTGDAPVPPGTPLPAPVTVHVLSRRVLDPRGPRPRLDLAVSLPLTTTADEVKATLQAAARSPDGRAYDAVRVRAFPGDLTHLVGPVGLLVLADDGRGWDGEGKTRRYQAVARHLGGTFSVTELRALTAVDRALGAGADLARAEAAAAKRTGQSRSAVAAAVTRARAAWPAP